MCGRKSSREELTRADDRDTLAFVEPPPSNNFQPNDNICSTHQAPVCINRDGERSLELLHWGLVPGWAKDTRYAAKMINARAETLAEKPSFEPSIDNRRCIVMVSRFYEWHCTGATKAPNKVEREDYRPMLLAGLWTHNDGLDINSYAVIATAAPKSFASIHDRAPVILEQSEIETWPDDDWASAGHLASPYRGARSAIEFSDVVNSNRNNDPELLEPVAA